MDAVQFLDTGPYAYIQHNRPSWDDGRTQKRVFDGVLRDGLVWWIPTASPAVVGRRARGSRYSASTAATARGPFVEAMLLSGNAARIRGHGDDSKDGTPFRQTLCDEWRV